jgi:hypothetical protein
MPKSTLEVSEELSYQLAEIGIDYLSNALALGLRQFIVPYEVYRYILDFLTSNPTSTKISDFRLPDGWSVYPCSSHRECRLLVRPT